MFRTTQTQCVADSLSRSTNRKLSPLDENVLTLQFVLKYTPTLLTLRKDCASLLRFVWVANVWPVRSSFELEWGWVRVRRVAFSVVRDEQWGHPTRPCVPRNRAGAVRCREDHSSVAVCCCRCEVRRELASSEKECRVSWKKMTLARGEQLMVIIFFTFAASSSTSRSDAARTPFSPWTNCSFSLRWVNTCTVLVIFFRSFRSSYKTKQPKRYNFYHPLNSK